MTSRRFLGLVLEFAQRVVKHVLDQRRFPRTTDAGDADKPIQGYLDIDIFEVVLTRAEDLQAWGLWRNGASLGSRNHLFLTREILRGQRAIALLQFRLGAEENNFATAFARTRSQIKDTVCRTDDIRVV